jgi:hypothetical protein
MGLSLLGAKYYHIVIKFVIMGLILDPVYLRLRPVPTTLREAIPEHHYYVSNDKVVVSVEASLWKGTHD